MRKRMLIAAVAVLGLAGCDLFRTPCGRVAADICTVPSESESCEFLKSVKSENELAQKTCESLAPTAKAYAADPTSLVGKAKWLGARVTLATVGFVGDRVAEKPADKLQRAGEQAGDALKSAGEAIKDAVKDAAK